MEIRLGKYLADCGVAARRKADEMIREGRVKVNGVVAVLGQKIDGGRDRVTVGGKRVAVEAERVTLMLHKPRGYITTSVDTHGRSTVMDLVPNKPYRLFPVGRLDQWSEGLLLLTNDGELARELTHPSSSIEKEYIATVHPEPTQDQITRVRRGVRTANLGDMRPAFIEKITDRDVRIVLTEGRKREIREMLNTVEIKVERLKRVRLGQLELGELKPGQWRLLIPADLVRLKKKHRGRYQ